MRGFLLSIYTGGQYLNNDKICYFAFGLGKPG